MVLNDSKLIRLSVKYLINKNTCFSFCFYNQYVQQNAIKSTFKLSYSTNFLRAVHLFSLVINNGHYQRNYTFAFYHNIFCFKDAFWYI